MNKKQKMFALVDQWHKSGLTRKEFTLLHNVGLSSFDYWCKKRHEQPVKVKNSPAFIEITSDPDLLPSQSLSASSQISQCPQIEISLPDGLQIKIY
jgi:hypothetical protein